MAETQRTRTGAQHLIDCLVAQGVDRVFCVPGESYLPVLDALCDVTDTIQTVTCRHEGGAAMMAEADGKMTGRPGICMVTRGPGATNASAGLHVARQDSTPMILFVGQIARDATDREAFQEIDYRRMFDQVAKWTAQIEDAARMGEYVARAFAVAMSGRPGPVVLALPEDMLVEEAQFAAPRRTDVPAAAPTAVSIVRCAELLSKAERPLVIVGGSRWDVGAKERLEAVAGRLDLPVVAAFRRQDRFDNTLPNYIGELGLGANPNLRRRLKEADLILLLGTRFGDIASNGYADMAIPYADQTLVHVHSCAEELGQVYQADLPIVATPGCFIEALSKAAVSPKSTWKDWLSSARADYEVWQQPRPAPGDVNMSEIIGWLRDTLPRDAILTNGAGNFSAWLHRFHRHSVLGTQLAPTSGSMGYGVPAAVAAALRHPERRVVCIAGDGDFMMTMQELATAAQYGAKPIYVIVDNGMLGTIRMHQETHYPARTIATDLVNPDFRLIGQACGAFTAYVDRTEDFAPVFQSALEADRLAVLHLRVHVEALTANSSLSQIRTQAEARASVRGTNNSK